MANQKNIEAKAAKAMEIQQKLADSQSVVVVDYRGYTVEEVVELRASMRKAGVEYLVLKNSIVERAAQQGNMDEAFLAYLKGPSAFAFGGEDVVAPAKIIKDFIKKTKKGEIKGGIINGVVSDAKAMDALADLPPRDVLIARVLGSIKAPISGLAIALNAIKEKAESAGAATAQEVWAPKTAEVAEASDAGTAEA